MTPNKRRWLVDVQLFVTASLYAAFLETYKERWEPEWTWAEVACGTALCLSSANLRTRQRSNPTWADHQRDVWASFVVGGAPVILWQLHRNERMHRALVDYLLEDRRANTTKTLAAERRGDAAGDV